MIVSQKKTENGLLVVVTDSNLIGKKFEEGKLHLDLTKDFYKGEEMNEEDLTILLQNARHIHLTGEKTVSIAKKLGLVEKIIVIDGVQHAQAVVE